MGLNTILLVPLNRYIYHVMPSMLCLFSNLYDSMCCETFDVCFVPNGGLLVLRRIVVKFAAADTIRP